LELGATHYAVGMVGGGWSQIGDERSEEDAPGVRCKRRRCDAIIRERSHTRDQGHKNHGWRMTVAGVSGHSGSNLWLGGREQNDVNLFGLHDRCTDYLVVYYR
jgi:hypothetical protein